MKTYTVRGPIKEETRRELEGYPDLLAHLLAHRGVLTAPEAERFLNPSYNDHLHDPFLLPDMEAAVSRILEAIRAGERIAIWSDYDCDGIPGGALLKDFFTAIGHENIVNYIPHRHEEGYGVNTPGLEELARGGVSLVVTVDCGIMDLEPARAAREMGLHLIVTDHHLPGAALPEALAVVNPRRADSRYPFPALAGTGVAWKLVEALLQRGNFSLPAGAEKWWLDLVGLATIADMMPLQGENRVLARYGLLVLRKSRRPGIGELCRKMRVSQRHLTEDDVGYMIAPRINAASRMGEPHRAFELLSTRDTVKAAALAEHLHSVNDERKGVVASMVKSIKHRIADVSEPREVIVVGDPRWRPALLGLAANVIVEEYRRPVFLWGREGTNVLKGSCRSDGSVNVVDLMALVGDTLLGYGGHAYSGGFSVSHENVHRLENALLEAYGNVRRENPAEPETVADAVLSFADITWETWRTIERLAPFGEGNPKPLFAFEDVSVRSAKPFGKSGDHLLLSLEDGGGTASAVSFFADEAARALAPGDRRTILATLERSVFRGAPELRLRLAGIVS